MCLQWNGGWFFKRMTSKISVVTSRTVSFVTKQDRQCSYDVTLRAVRVTTFAVEKLYIDIYIKYSERLSVFLSYISGMQRACAVLYFYLWPVWLYRIFPQCLTNGKIFGKSISNVLIWHFICLALFLKVIMVTEKCT